MFGLTNTEIAQKLEAMEGVDACTGYVLLQDRKKKNHIPQGDGEEDDSFELDSAESTQDFQDLQALQNSDDLDLRDLQDFQKAQKAQHAKNTQHSEDAQESHTEQSEEELEEEALEEVKALSARRESRAAKTGKPKQQSGKASQATEKKQEMVVKTLKRAMVGKDTFLCVRCRYCEDGLEAEDSLMYVCNVRLRRSDNLIQVEYPASLFKVKKERAPKKDNASSSKKAELPPNEAMFLIDMSGTYRTGFEAVDRSEGRVSVKPCSSSLLKSKPEHVLRKMKWALIRIMRNRHILESDLKAGARGHMLQLLYACRLLKPSPSLQDSTGITEVLERLGCNDDLVLAEEAHAVLERWKRGKKRGQRKEGGDDAKVPAKKPKKDVPPVLSDDVSFEPPICDEKAEQMPISIRIKHWGIKYHERDCFVYAMGEQSIFILFGNSVAVAPAASYASFFTREQRLFEMSWQVYAVLRALAKHGEPLLYDRVLGDVWNENHSAEVLLVEEDFFAEYPFLKRELLGLDQVRGLPPNVNTLSMNEFMDTLQWKYENWKHNLGNPDYQYLLEDELEVAYFRGGLLESDEKVEEEVESGVLPAPRGCVYPEPTVYELSPSDWK